MSLSLLCRVPLAWAIKLTFIQSTLSSTTTTCTLPIQTLHKPPVIMSSAGLPGRGFPGPPGVLGIKGQSPSILNSYNPSSTGAKQSFIMAFSFSVQVTKVVQASLALQVIQVSLVLKVTRGFQVSRDPRVSQERGGSQVSLSRALRETGEKQDNPEKQVCNMHGMETLHVSGPDD